MSYPWITDYNSPDDPRKAVQIKHIITGNDGDVCNSCVTYEILKGNEPKFCVDIGVDEGWWSFFAASVNPNCSIIAFEPNPISYNALLPYLNQQKQITLHNLAISDCSGTLPFTMAGDQSNSRAHSEFRIPCNTIDTFITRIIARYIIVSTTVQSFRNNSRHRSFSYSMLSDEQISKTNASTQYDILKIRNNMFLAYYIIKIIRSIF